MEKEITCNSVVSNSIKTYTENKSSQIINTNTNANANVNIDSNNSKISTNVYYDVERLMGSISTMTSQIKFKNMNSNSDTTNILNNNNNNNTSTNENTLIKDLQIKSFNKENIKDFIKNVIRGIEKVYLEKTIDKICESFDNNTTSDKLLKKQITESIINNFCSIEGVMLGHKMIECYFYEILVSLKNNNLDEELLNQIKINVNFDDDDKLNLDNKEDNKQVKLSDICFTINILAHLSSMLYQKLPRSKLKIIDINELYGSNSKSNDDVLCDLKNYDSALVDKIFKTYFTSLEEVLVLMDKYMVFLINENTKTIEDLIKQGSNDLDNNKDDSRDLVKVKA